VPAPAFVSALRLRAFCQQVYQRAGVPDEDAAAAADVRLQSTLRQPAGFDAFSVARLQNTVRRLRAGGINPAPRIRVVHERGPFARLDADNGLGPVVGMRAMTRCLEAAREGGFALAGMRNSTTLGTMATYAMRALSEGFLGFVGTNTELKIGLPPWGGLTPALGNNPFAVAIPRRHGAPLVLDMSLIATQPQESGAAAEPPARRPLGNEFLPRPIIGAHKGYGLAVVLEVLCGVLPGAGFGQAHAPGRLADPQVRHDLGHLFGVLDPTVFMPRREFEARIEQLCAEIKQSEPAPGVPRILLPGELEHERSETRLRRGIPVHVDAQEALRAFCGELGIASPLD
jgi:LDH2 family malate/lactate/ureidoglycolate dehydrogenase